MIPVHKINMGKFPSVQLSVLDGHGLATAKKDTAQMTIRIHAGIVPGLTHVAPKLGVYITSVLCVDRSRMTILMLLRKIRNHFPHNIQKIMLKIFQIKGIYIMGALLNHNRAGGMMRGNTTSSVFDSRCLHDLQNLL